VSTSTGFFDTTATVVSIFVVITSIIVRRESLLRATQGGLSDVLIRRTDGTADRLFHNNGDGTFTSVEVAGTPTCKGLSVTFVTRP
jgi:hypothetical protein